MHSLKRLRPGSSYLLRTTKLSIIATLLLLLGFSSISSAQVEESLDYERLEPSSEDSRIDGFATSVAIEGDTMVIGTPFDGLGAAYVFERTETGWVEQQRLAASDLLDGPLGEESASGHDFGHAVAISDDRIVITAPYETIFDPTSPVGFLVGSVSGSTQGAAYVFELVNGVWELEQRLDADDFARPDTFRSLQFGQSVAFQDGTIVVGAPGTASRGILPSPLVDGDFGAAGAAFIYEVDEGEWFSSAELTTEPVNEEHGYFIHDYGNFFGHSVAIDGDTVVVGAPADGLPLFLDLEDPFFDGEAILDLSEGLLFESETLLGARIEVAGGNGAAYVFAREEGSWSQTDRLIGDEEEFDFDGLVPEEVFDLDSLVPEEVFDLDSVVVEEVFDLDSVVVEDGSDFGGVVVGDPDFLIPVIVPPLGGLEPILDGDQFGYSVAIDAGTIVVGAQLEDGDSFDEGAAYIFSDDGDGWVEQQTLTPTLTETESRFGRSITIEGSTIIAGAPFSNEFTGSAYTFSSDGETWTQEFDLITSDVATGHGFGFSVALDNSTAVVGAPLAFLSDRSGDAYVFEFASEADEVAETEDPEDVDEEPPVPTFPVAPVLLCNGLEVTVNLALGQTPTDGDDVILGTDGADIINAGAGADTICAGGGDDIINAGAGADTVFGDDGNDLINLGQGRDTAYAGAGDDFVSGGKGKDTISGGSGNDELRGNEGTDRLLGGSGNDELRGGQKADVLKGNAGSDTLLGGTHPDTLDGGRGLDAYNGGGSLRDICAADASGLTELSIRCEL